MGETLVIAAVSTLLVAAVGREVYGFVQWKRQKDRMERHEWARVIRLLRD
jgi:hypothetical protein